MQFHNLTGCVIWSVLCVKRLLWPGCGPIIFCVQDLRQQVAMSISVLLVCDVFLNPKYVTQKSQALSEVLKYTGSTFGVTKKDILEIAPAIRAHLDEAVASEPKTPSKTSSVGNNGSASSKKKKLDPGSGAEAKEGQGDNSSRKKAKRKDTDAQDAVSEKHKAKKARKTKGAKEPK